MSCLILRAYPSGARSFTLESMMPGRRRYATFGSAEPWRSLKRGAREAKWPEAVAAIRLLALTGCRRGEVPDLRWRDIGYGAIVLEDSKTGPRTVRLGEAAQAITCSSMSHSSSLMATLLAVG